MTETILLVIQDLYWQLCKGIECRLMISKGLCHQQREWDDILCPVGTTLTSVPENAKKYMNYNMLISTVSHYMVRNQSTNKKCVVPRRIENIKHSYGLIN